LHPHYAAATNPQRFRRPVVERRIRGNGQRYARDGHWRLCMRNVASGATQVVVFEILKAIVRKAAQVVHFKDARWISAADVDNFVRKCLNCADKCFRRTPSLWER